MSAMAQAGILVPVDWTSCCVSQLSIPVASGRSVRAVKYSRSEGKSAGLVVYFHGGGWTFGAPEFGEKYFEPLVKELGVAVVSVAYGLAPEEKWPVAVGDAGGAVEWVRSFSLPLALLFSYRLSAYC
jgi:acetyl esterase/lipase